MPMLRDDRCSATSSALYSCNIIINDNSITMQRSYTVTHTESIHNTVLLILMSAKSNGQRNLCAKARCSAKWLHFISKCKATSKHISVSLTSGCISLIHGFTGLNVLFMANGTMLPCR